MRFGTVRGNRTASMAMFVINQHLGDARSFIQANGSKSQGYPPIPFADSQEYADGVNRGMPRCHRGGKGDRPSGGACWRGGWIVARSVR